MKKSEKQLVEYFRALPEAERNTLLVFAEFLVQRCETPTDQLLEPEPITRPEEESVIAAVKRLSATFHMLDKGKMLGETSELVSQHVVRGREASEVIDELEHVFQRHYESYKAGKTRF